ncbi:MAG: hypothetical protein KIT84_42135 [Labilithrix sp.]|nr:hypothetical protein [Labilithrix sp.]MCW5817675.1 hypothetical protein [Labilithrix sp.]
MLRESFPPGVTELPKLSRTSGMLADPILERAFQKEHFELTVRRYTRFSIAIATAAMLSYGVHDALVVPEVRDRAWLIRYAFFGPVAALILLFLFRNRRPERHQPAMLVFGLAVNTVVLWIGAIAHGGGAFIYTSYAVVFVTLGPFLARMNVRTQAIYTALSIVLYLALDAALARSAGTYRFSWVMALTTLGTIGVLAARQLEVQSRMAFLQKRVISDQMIALEAERMRSESLLLNVLPRRIAERLKTAPEQTIADRFEGVTVLFSDIVGFTEMSSRLDAKTIVTRLDEVFSKFDDVAEALGLEKIKTIGDAYMVAGGVPTPRKDHAEAVCDMALRMRDVIAELAAKADEPIRIRIGVHSGPVIAGVIGKKKFIYDVWGDTVNSASRMESHGVPGAIQVSEATYEATKDAFDYEERGTISVKGKGEMKTYLLLGRREEEGDRPASLPLQSVTPRR